MRSKMVYAGDTGGPGFTDSWEEGGDWWKKGLLRLRGENPGMDSPLFLFNVFTFGRLCKIYIF